MFLPAKIMCPVTGKSFGDYLFFFNFFIFISNLKFNKKRRGAQP